MSVRRLPGRLLVAAMLLCASCAHAEGAVMVKSRPGSFEEVRDDLIYAIEGRSLKVSHVNYIGAMLDRTAAAVGSSRQVYGQAEQVEFCKADLSRELMETDPANIVFCPYSIAVYTVPGQANTVFLAFRRPTAMDASPASRTALEKIERLLSAIVAEVLQ